jgi:hypothetical protein
MCHEESLPSDRGAPSHQKYFLAERVVCGGALADGPFEPLELGRRSRAFAQPYRSSSSYIGFMSEGVDR